MPPNRHLETVRSEDFVEYFFFPAARSPDNNSIGQDLLDDILIRINEIAADYCANYIWHKDGFRVMIRHGNANLLLDEPLDNNSDNEPLPPHLYGITFFDDNIQDEWFIVSLLFELSRRIEGLIIRVVDSDGEFMMIEAAEHLPNWANPDTCSERVYIVNGNLHLVLDGCTDDTAPPSTSVSKALAQIRSNPSHHQMTPDVQQCINERIKCYPSNVTANQHRQTVYVPVAAAALLAEQPKLVAAAVRALVHRDPIDMKACRAMKYFPPENRVRTSVVFSKYLYAMLTHSQYTPDRRTGWNLPPNQHQQFKEHSLGVKLACGFEILAAQAQPCDDFEGNKNWLKYLDSLKDRGYFQEFIEGSRDHQRLLQTAKDYFKIHVDTLAYNSEVGQNIVSLLRSLDYSADDFRENESTLPVDDDDSWLNVSPDELDEMLASRYGIKKTISANGNVDAVELTGDISEFLDRKSEWDGVQIEEGKSKSSKTNATKKNESSVRFQNADNSLNTSNGIDFNPEDFQRHVQEMLDLVIPDDAAYDSNSEMSDFEDDDNLDRNLEAMANGGGDGGKSMKNYMDQMDEELARTTIGKSFENKSKKKEDNFDDIESFTPVDIDVNTLKNMAHSYQSQFGGPGPASSLLGSMGIHVKPDETEDIRDTQV